MITAMSEMDVKALKANFDIWTEERAVGLKKHKAFERYVFEQVLKDHDPADEDLDIGDLGDGGDGGVDGMFLYMGGQLIGDETPAPVAASDIELHIIQAKFEPNFKETTIEKLESFAHDLLAYDKAVGEITYLNSKAKDAIRNFRTKYDQMLGRPHKLAVIFHYACIASEIPDHKDKVMARAENLKSYVKSILTLADVNVSTWGAAALLDSARSVPFTTVVIPFDRLFSTGDQSTVCLVKLTSFADRMLSTADGHLQTRFLEPNVRDYQGKNNPVNAGIRETLENPDFQDDFWWVNNGITILALRCGTSGDQVSIENPEIVNGLQTSHEIFNWYRTRPGVTDSRRVLLRIIVSPDEKSRTRIIKATNSQTKVTDLSLLSTEPIQQTIEERLRLNGLYYDRKKGQCRRLKRPIKKVVGMKDMAKAVIAIALRQPDQARGRPESFVRTNSASVFNPDADGDLYAACIVLDRQIEDFLESSTLSIDEQRNIRYYMGMLLISTLLDVRRPSPLDIAASFERVQGVATNDMEWACAETLKTFQLLGGTDQAAKSSDMTQEMENFIEKVC